MFNPAVHSLIPIAAPIVESSLGAQWLPVVLAIIEHESGGEPGIRSAHECKNSEMIPKISGGFEKVKHAYGLMQVIPKVVLEFSEIKGKPVFFEQISGKTQNDCEMQIKIGCWLLKRFKTRMQQVVRVHLPDGNLDNDGLAAVVMAYGIGARPIIDAILILKEKGIAPTFENLNSHFPFLGQPGNYPFKFARWILSKIGKALTFSMTDSWPLVLAFGLSLYLLFK